MQFRLDFSSPNSFNEIDPMQIRDFSLMDWEGLSVLTRPYGPGKYSAAISFVPSIDKILIMIAGLQINHSILNLDVGKRKRKEHVVLRILIEVDRWN